jgi:hypothetical protein
MALRTVSSYPSPTRKTPRLLQLTERDESRPDDEKLDPVYNKVESRG